MSNSKSALFEEENVNQDAAVQPVSIADRLKSYAKQARIPAMKKARELITQCEYICGWIDYETEIDTSDPNYEDIFVDATPERKSNLDSVASILALGELASPGFLDEPDVKAAVANSLELHLYACQTDYLSTANVEADECSIMIMADNANQNPESYISAIRQFGGKVTDFLVQDMNESGFAKMQTDFSVPYIGHADIWVKEESEDTSTVSIVANGFEIIRYVVNTRRGEGIETGRIYCVKEQSSGSTPTSIDRLIRYEMIRKGILGSSDTDMQIISNIPYDISQRTDANGMVTSNNAMLYAYSIRNAIETGAITESIAHRMVYRLLTMNSVPVSDSMLFSRVIALYTDFRGSGPFIDSADTMFTYLGGIDWVLPFILGAFSRNPFSKEEFRNIVHITGADNVESLLNVAELGLLKCIDTPTLLAIRPEDPSVFDRCVIRYWCRSRLKLSDEYFYVMLNYRHITADTMETNMYPVARMIAEVSCPGSKKLRYFIGKFCNRRFCQMVSKLGTLEQRHNTVNSIKQVYALLYNSVDDFEKAFSPDGVNQGVKPDPMRDTISDASFAIGKDTVKEVLDALMSAIVNNNNGISPPDDLIRIIKYGLRDHNMILDVFSVIYNNWDPDYSESMRDVCDVLTKYAGIKLNANDFITAIDGVISGEAAGEKILGVLGHTGCMAAVSEYFPIAQAILKDKLLCKQTLEYPSCVQRYVLCIEQYGSVEDLETIVNIAKRIDYNVDRPIYKLAQFITTVYGATWNNVSVLNGWLNDDFYKDIIDTVSSHRNNREIYNEFLSFAIDVLMPRASSSINIYAFTKVDGMLYDLVRKNDLSNDDFLHIMRLMRTEDMQRAASDFITLDDMSLIGAYIYVAITETIHINGAIFGRNVMKIISYIRTIYDDDPYRSEQIIKHLGLDDAIGKKAESSVDSTSAVVLNAIRIGEIMWTTDYYSGKNGTPAPGNPNVPVFSEDELESVIPPGWRLPTYDEVEEMSSVAGETIRFVKTGCIDANGSPQKVNDACFWSSGDGTAPEVEVFHGNEFREFDIEDSTGYKAPLRLVRNAD